MRPINAVLVHHDPVLAQGLRESLRNQFRKLAVCGSIPEFEDTISRLRASFAIVDLECVSYAELKRLCAEFPGTAFVCIHRLADEAMWADALEMGAVDCCQSTDLRGMVLASERYARPTGWMRPLRSPFDHPCDWKGRGFAGCGGKRLRSVFQKGFSRAVSARSSRS